jgi:hypothetical protein
LLVKIPENKEYYWYFFRLLTLFQNPYRLYNDTIGMYIFGFSGKNFGIGIGIGIGGDSVAAYSLPISHNSGHWA